MRKRACASQPLSHGPLARKATPIRNLSVRKRPPKKALFGRSAKTPRLVRRAAKPHLDVMTYTLPPNTLTPLIPMLKRRARRLTRSDAEADDLVQDTLLRLLQRLRRKGPVDDLPAYAMRTLTNQARMAWRRPPPPEELDEADASVEPDAPLRLDCADTLRAIEELPREQARLLRMVAQGETSPAMLAKRTGIPLGTVMSRLSRARTRLRDMLETPAD